MSALILTQRDISIILMVYSYGGVSIDHVFKRFFSSAKTARACYRGLRNNWSRIGGKDLRPEGQALAA